MHTYTHKHTEEMKAPDLLVLLGEMVLGLCDLRHRRGDRYSLTSF